MHCLRRALAMIFFFRSQEVQSEAHLLIKCIFWGNYNFMKCWALVEHGKSSPEHCWSSICPLGFKSKITATILRNVIITGTPKTKYIYAFKRRGRRIFWTVWQAEIKSSGALKASIDNTKSQFFVLVLIFLGWNYGWNYKINRFPFGTFFRFCGSSKFFWK